ncbi:FAD dependent oxidoreductase-domain-containing protein [Endogone sp. FLAS-F59071]|nr:FAD dependent oxidoreductase-domain-containing protein [Endogone sp. FLAS-F59071]|eukprot:RUS21830.1 FAD dependent oxidoreductase-domain-containing protein [Endogone sp. FLAS-F59071]
MRVASHRHVIDKITSQPMLFYTLANYPSPLLSPFSTDTYLRKLTITMWRNLSRSKKILSTTLLTATAGTSYLIYSEIQRSKRQHAKYLASLQADAVTLGSAQSMLPLNSFTHSEPVFLESPPDDIKPHSLWTPPSRREMLNLLRGLDKDGKKVQDRNEMDPPFDLLVVGGGATGAGIAVDAATRGLKVALVERDDFASGASSRSTKLVHGGVRYLQKAILELDYEQYKLVKEALHERATFLKIAPYLSSQLPIMLPVYNVRDSDDLFHTRKHRWWQVPYFWVGCKAYDLLAGRESLQSSYFLPKGKALEAFPMLKGDKLVGALVYYDGNYQTHILNILGDDEMVEEDPLYGKKSDGQHNDARMNVALILTAVSHGAVVANHVEAKSLVKNEKNDVCGAIVRDVLTGDVWTVRAKGVINATGPFTDGLRKMDEASTKEIVAPSAGVHIILPNYYSPGNMGLIDPDTSDGRVIFFLPWQGNAIAGTTEIVTFCCSWRGMTDTPTEVTQNPLPKEEEITWILDEVARYLNAGNFFSALFSSDSQQNQHNFSPHIITNPDVKVRRGDVLAAWSGIRPLVRDPAAKDTQSLVRNHMINVSPSKLITIAGGKWTTYRSMAKETVDKAIEVFNLTPLSDCRSELVKLVGSHGYSNTMFIKLIQQFGLETEVAQHLANSYGDRAWAVASLAQATGKRWPVFGKRLSSYYPYIEAEVRYAVRREYACTAVDVIARRTRIAFLNAQAALEALPRIIEIMGSELNWSQERRKNEYNDAIEFLVTMGLPSPKSHLLYPLNADHTSAGEPFESGAIKGQAGSARSTSPILAHIPDTLYSRAQFHPEEIKEFQTVFAELDADGDGHINSADLAVVLDKLGVVVSGDVLVGIIAEVDLDKNGTIEFNEFLEVMSSVKEIQIRKEFARIVASFEERKELGRKEAALQQAKMEHTKNHHWWNTPSWNRGGKDGKGEKIDPGRSGGGV